MTEQQFFDEDALFDEEGNILEEVVEDELDELSKEFVVQLVDKTIVFTEKLTGHEFRSYQLPLARRIIESMIIGDGEQITALASRQSGKSEVVANTVAGLMVLLPKLALMFPDLLGKFKGGLLVGVFAPVEGQVETLFGRIQDRLSSAEALEILNDRDIADSIGRVPGVTRQIRLKSSRSSVSMMTANPKAKIESKTFHMIIIDECQDSDNTVVKKSISPMLADSNGTMVKLGTPSTEKNNFYDSIQQNKRRQLSSRAKQNHFEWDWKAVAKVNPNYGKFIKKEMLRIGEESDEFRLSYCCEWLLDRGMFITSAVMDILGDTSAEIQHAWHRTPVVVGIDPARKVDSTVVTVLWVDWDRQDEFGYYDHRVLNWLEIQGDDWEDQYFQIQQFLSNYDVIAVGVDANGVGDAVAQRLRLLLPRSEVYSLGSSLPEQTKRWVHLKALIDRRLIGWPAHAKTRRLRAWKKFYQQMTDAETKFSGPNFGVQAPDEVHAHDDFVDSLALAACLTMDMTMPTMEVTGNLFFR